MDYSIAFKIDGAWTEDVNFKRDLFSSEALDETLDTAVIVDAPSDLRDIKPFTLCRVRALENNAIAYENYYWTGDFNAEAISNFSQNSNYIQPLLQQKFKQTVSLIELTKILEREPCDSLAFMHRIQPNEPDDAEYVTPVYTASGSVSPSIITGNPNEVVKSPAVSPFVLRFIKTSADDGYTSYFISVYEGQTRVFYSGQLSGSSIGATGDIYRFITLDPGNYTIKYEFYYYRSTPGITTEWRLTADYSVTVNENIVSKTIPSITDVINRTLSIYKNRPVGIAYPPKYTLDPYIADLFSDVPAPEFTFTRNTLFEALMTIGYKIHGIPRLVMSGQVGDENRTPSVITFDLLGLDDTYKFPQGCEIVGYKIKRTADDFCGGIDNYVENCINTVDPEAGSIVDPAPNAYKTLRCEGGAIVTNDTAAYEAPSGIYRVLKFEMGFTDGSTTEPIGDVTQFVYEQAEYDGLYIEDTSTFPNSKQYALVYKQGDRYIRGFDTKGTSVLAFLQQFQAPAINKITNALKSGAMTANQIYGNLAFRLTYIPMDNFRVRQMKPYYKEYPTDNILYNSQNANTVESSAYGENLKGKIARMGNKVEIFTAKFTSRNDAPKIGNLLLDEEDKEVGYVYKTTFRDGRYYSYADIYVTPDFNRLSSYFAINSNFRLFEVSERQSVERQITIDRIIRVSLSGSQAIDVYKSTMRGGWLSSGSFNAYQVLGRIRFMNTFLMGRNALVRGKAMVAYVNTDGSYKDLFALPVNSAAFGNSIAFNFTFEDSFSAGKRTTGAQGYMWKQLKSSPYGNKFGEFDDISIRISPAMYDVGTNPLLAKLHTPTAADQTTPGGFSDSLPMIPGAASMDNYALWEEVGKDCYMQFERTIKKNSAEKISFTVQYHLQADDKKIVFGPEMFYNNLLIRDEEVKDQNGNVREARVYGIKRGRLNNLRGRIDIQSQYVVDCGAIQDVGETTPQYLRTMTLSQSEDFVAWCIADSTNGDIYIGVNEEVKAGQNTSPIYFHFDEEA